MAQDSCTTPPSGGLASGARKHYGRQRQDYTTPLSGARAISTRHSTLSYPSRRRDEHRARATNITYHTVMSHTTTWRPAHLGRRDANDQRRTHMPPGVTRVMPRWQDLKTTTCVIPLAYKRRALVGWRRRGPLCSTLAHLDLGFILGGLLGVPRGPSRDITD